MVNTMTLSHVIDSTIAGTPIVIDINDRNGNSNYYNVDTVPRKYDDYMVDWIELIEQYDGTQVICFTVNIW